MVALNDAIADGRDVSWIWDVDFEPLLDGLERSSRPATARPSWRCGCVRRPRPGADRGRARSRARARPRPRADAAGRRARRAADLHGDAGAAADRRRARACRGTYWEERRMRIRRRASLSGLPEHLRRPRQHRGARAAGAPGAGTSSTSRAIGLGDRVAAGRARPLLRRRRPGPRAGAVAPDLAAKGEPLREAVDRRRGAARGLRRLPAARPLLPRPAGDELPGVGALPAAHGRRRAADDRRRPARVRLEPGGDRRSPGSRTTPAGRCSTRAPSRSAGSSPASATTASAATRAAASARAIGTYLHGPLLPRNPWLADWLLAQALAHRTRRGAGARAAPGRARARGACRLGRAGAATAAAASRHAKHAARSADPHPGWGRVPSALGENATAENRTWL